MQPRYHINLVRLIRLEEERQARRRQRFTLLTTLSVVLLGLSLAYGGWQVLEMERVLRKERKNLSRLESQYRQYTETEALIGDADIRLLDDLKNNSIFWTRVLAAIARHLPDGYATTGLNYDGETLVLEGTGRVSARQRQLVKLHGYMNALKSDPAFADVFSTIYLNSAKSENDKGRKLRFSLTAER